MADIADRAGDAIEAALSDQLARQARRVAPSGATECEDCGIPIPTERLRVVPFATRCVDCQTDFERRVLQRNAGER